MAKRDYVPHRNAQAVQAGMKSREDDLAELNRALGAFVGSMQSKLITKYDKGYCGWNDPRIETHSNLLRLLKKNLEECDYIDVANLAMMLHLRQRAIHHEVREARR